MLESQNAQVTACQNAATLLPMDLSASELAAIGATFDGLPNTPEQRAALLNSMFIVVQLQRTGDSTRDPYRTATGFFDRARAQAFANSLTSLAQSSCVVLYQGTSQLTVVGDSSLIDLWARRTSPPQANPSLVASEVSDVAAQVLGNDPAVPLTTDTGDYPDQTIT